MQKGVEVKAAAFLCKADGCASIQVHFGFDRVYCCLGYLLYLLLKLHKQICT